MENKATSNLKISLSKRLESVGYIDIHSVLSWLRLIVWSLQVPKAPYMMFGTRIVRLWSTNGPTFVVQYTKECTRIVQAFVSGNPVFVTELPISLVGGLPRIVPGVLRSLLRDGDPLTTRGVLSVFAVYRIIKIPGKLKLDTITSPFTGMSSVLLDSEIKLAYRELTGRIRPSLQPISLSRLGTAGPNHPTSMLGIWKDILAWRDSPILEDLKTYCQSVPGGPEFLSLILKEMEVLSQSTRTESKPLILGKLSEKNEGAGKIRVFAITDSITQSVFRPLSDMIFSILRRLPMDGTFNQGGPVAYLLDLHNQGRLEGQTLYSYDLSAATDRLPISFQEQVLTLLIGKELAKSWVNILTLRDWYHMGIPLRYSVGQPMGALSSWASLALSHHILVRIAANRVGFPNFKSYALLGDDIVIANESVAKSYHFLLTTVLGVEINLSKSLVSKHSFEFAKRLVTFKGEVSPIGAKNLLVGLKSLKGIPSILLDLSNKGFSLSEELCDKLYQSIPTVRKGQLERLSWLVKGPFGFVPTIDRLSTDIKLSNSFSSFDFNRFLSSVEEAVYLSSIPVWDRNLSKTHDIIKSLLRMDSIPGFTLESVESPLYLHILDLYWQDYGRLIQSEPVWKPTVDGFKVFNFFEKPMTTPEAISRLNELLSDDQLTVSPLDPFQTAKVILPLSHAVKSENFWLTVKGIEDEKTRLFSWTRLF